MASLIVMSVGILLDRIAMQTVTFSVHIVLHETRPCLFDVIKSIVIVLCKEAKMEDEEFQDTVCYFVLREALEIQVDRLKKEVK